MLAIPSSSGGNNNNNNSNSNSHSHSPPILLMFDNSDNASVHTSSNAPIHLGHHHGHNILLGSAGLSNIRASGNNSIVSSGCVASGGGGGSGSANVSTSGLVFWDQEQEEEYFRPKLSSDK